MSYHKICSLSVWFSKSILHSTSLFFGEQYHMDSWCSMCCKATDDCVPEENKISMFYFNSPCLRLFIFKEGPCAFQNVADINYLGNNGRTLSIPLGNRKIGEVPMKSLLRIEKKNIFVGSIGRSIARKKLSWKPPGCGGVSGFLAI